MDRFLQSVTLFESLTRNELKEIKRIVRREDYKKNELIFREGETGTSFYLILQGLVKVFRLNANGKNKTLSLLDYSDFFGEMALLDNKRRSASVKTLEATQLLVIDKQKFRRLIEKFPDISFKIIAVLCERLRKANNQIQHLTFDNVRDRLETKLIDLAKKYGRETTDGVRLTHKITHQELANLVGTTRVTTTKILNKLKEEGKLLTKDKYLILTTDYLKAKKGEGFNGD